MPYTQTQNLVLSIPLLLQLCFLLLPTLIPQPMSPSPRMSRLATWLQRSLRPLRPLLEPLLAPVLSQEPVDQLIRRTAKQQWQLLAFNLGGSLVEALSEGATLGVLFLAVELLTSPETARERWSTLPVVSSLPPHLGFLSLLGLAVGLQALQSVARYGSQVANGYFAARCRALVTGEVHSQVLRLSYPCASLYKVGDLTDYASQGPEAIRNQVDQSGQLVMNLLLTTTYLVVLLKLSPWLLLAALLMAAVVGTVQRQLLPRLVRQAQLVTQTQVAISERITEDFQGLRMLHSSGQRRAADRAVEARLGELERALRYRSRVIEVVGPLANFLPVLAIALIAALAVLLLQSRSSGILPSLVTFVIALQRLNTRIAGVNSALSGLADNSGRLDRLNQILSPAGKQFCREGGQLFSKLRSGISFEMVSLRYAPELPESLSEIFFSLPEGQMLALVGPSGAGKSSIADLLVGLYSPTAGRILIDGVPLETLDLVSWQQQLGVVSQDTFLFNASLADNIAYGTPGATFAQVKAAAAAAQAAGFIAALPQGYDTMVGERGYRLSGGQRQRISLARAILRNPELLILDEATSALDSQSERLVQEAIERFERNHTVLVIAHRLSTIVRADQILVLDHGQVAERGTHASLLAQDGLYHQLWKQQSMVDRNAISV